MKLQDIQNPVSAELQAVQSLLQRHRKTLCGSHAYVDNILRSFLQNPGKMLRPTLTLLSAFVTRPDELKSSNELSLYNDLITLASITELVHAASLMHDDVLDGADSRRNMPSLNAEFGNKIAILAGDMLYSHAFELLADRFDRKINRLLAECVRMMTRGEINNLKDHDFSGYQGIIADKTAVFMSFCCEAGASLVQTPDGQATLIHDLSRFGYHFGMVYQLTDDLTDKDDTIAVRYPEGVMGLLNQHIREAEATLSRIPPSTFSDSLSMLLRFVISQSQPVETAKTTLAG